MLLRRVLATDEKNADIKADQWIPLPYDGRGLSLPGFSQTPDQTGFVRLICDATFAAGRSARLWLPILFRVTDPTLSTARVAIRECLTSGQRNKIVATATLLSGYTHNVVFSEHELVAEILDAARQCGSDCLDEAKSSELFGLAVSGAYSGTPGEPAPHRMFRIARTPRRLLSCTRKMSRSECFIRLCWNTQ